MPINPKTHSWRVYKLYSNTLGAALKRLIKGLRDGGARNQGEEFDSGSDANASIAAFSDYLELLNDEAKSMLMEASKLNRFDNKSVKLKQLWDRLARPKEAEYTNSIYCVELIATQLEEILLANPGLYDVCSFMVEVEDLAGLSVVTANYTAAMQVMKDTLPALKLHTYYEGTREDEVCVNFIRIMSYTKDFNLTSADILYFLKQYDSMEKKAGGDFSEIGTFLQKAVTTCSNDIFVEAKAAMTEDEVVLFHRVTRTSREPHDRSIDRFKLFPPPPGKRLAEDESIYPPSRARRLMDDSSDNSLV